MLINKHSASCLSAVICIILSGVQAVEKKCLTPNQETAECISIRKCPILLKAIGSKDETSTQFAKESQCGYDSDPLVCCGKSGNYTQPYPDLLPNRRYCGLQHSDDYLTNKNETSGSSSIDEFPWLAALIYEEDHKEKNLCVGTLISDRYVLTTAYCLYPRESELKKVRLGEYNIEQNRDCITDGNFNECSDPTADFGVEAMIVHTQYNRRQQINDIGLIRLNNTVLYSDYIRPICLPLQNSPRPKTGEILSVSGWGRRTYTGEEATTKKKVLTELISGDVCAQAYTKRRIEIRKEQHMCTKDISNSTVSCHGDGGGPVMYSYKNQWFQEGIVDFGLGCGSTTPDVNVKVAYFVDWILRNIRP